MMEMTSMSTEEHWRYRKSDQEDDDRRRMVIMEERGFLSCYTC